MSAVTRRLRSVPTLVAAAMLLLILLPVWLPVVVLVDAMRGRFRLPTARLLGFGLCWAWLEVAGVTVAFALWLVRRADDEAAHFRLQRWWAARLMAALRVTTGITVDTADATCLSPGPAIMLSRHASLADSLLSAWVITTVAGMNPRYVLKRELLVDPCLDIVGNRLPNHFLDRESPDSTVELASLSALSAGLEHDQIAVIFPEGTRASDAKRSRALERIRQSDPRRAEHLAGLQHLLPPRPAGTVALATGCPTADFVVAWHVGFDGLDTFGGVLRHLRHRPRPAEFHARRVARSDVPDGDAFTHWLDEQWLKSDRAVHALLQQERNQ